MAARSWAAGRTVNVEYVSANPTGPMHMGHCRGAVVGDALAGLLEFSGHKVIREYYVNDAGGQVRCARPLCAHLRYREALGEEIEDIPEGLYPGDYLKPVGETPRAGIRPGLQGRAGERMAAELFRERSVAAMMDMIREDLVAAWHPSRPVLLRGQAAGSEEAGRGRGVAARTRFCL